MDKPHNGGVQARRVAQRSAVACNAGLARAPCFESDRQQTQREND
jgi:hypothetical protein